MGLSTHRRLSAKFYSVIIAICKRIVQWLECAVNEMSSAGQLSPDRLRVPGVAFLLSQLGFQSSRLWRDRLAPLGIDPRHAVLLRHVAASQGETQQALGARMQLPASRMVALVDELEGAGLLERRRSIDDRRSNALFLTGDGQKMLDRLMEVSAQHEAELCQGLSEAERQRLIELLGLVALEQGVARGVHPGVAVSPRVERFTEGEEKPSS